jgi:acyl-CoA synthetase (AMP-forming)/AMP-acid ligase II
MQGAKLALEPNYNQDQFLHTLMMYQPHYVAATKSFWVNICKKILFDKRYRNVKFENLFIACSCGESFELNEEALVNEVMKKAKMGTNVTHTPFSVVKMSEAAGDCEHGSIFYTLFRAYGNLKRKNRRNGDAEGVKPIAFVEVAVLDEKGNHLPPYQYGRLVANSPCTMKGYKNNPEATRDFFITDSSGKVWGDMNVYGYLDDSGKAHIRGRIPKEGELIPPFVIAKEILRDLKNILSCEVIKDATTGIYIAHVELQPTTKNNPADILAAAQERCNSLLNKYGIKLCYRLRSFDESYPLTGSGKRDVKALVREGLTEKCVIPVIEDEKAVLKKYISEDEIKKIK